MHQVSYTQNTTPQNVEINFVVDDADASGYVKYLGNENLTFSPIGESLVIFSLLPAMANGGGQLFCEATVSGKFFTALEKIQDIYKTWQVPFKRVTVNGHTIGDSQQRAERVGIFFTGGVDSSFSLLKNKEDITDLIYIHGLDVGLDDKVLREKTSQTLHKLAADFGKNVIELESDLRSFFDRYFGWGDLGHGVVLAGIGHLLSGHFKRIYIPSSNTYMNLFPWGTHPILDPLWSSDRLEFVHDGCEANRIEKIKAISQHDSFLKGLRVCWENPDSQYNCCQCEKCVRTMVSLKIIGMLDRAETFHKPLKYSDVRKLAFASRPLLVHLQENIDESEQSNTDKRLRFILRWVYFKSNLLFCLKNFISADMKKKLKKFASR